MFRRAPFQMFSFLWCIKPINYLLSAYKYPLHCDAGLSRSVVSDSLQAHGL